MTVTGHDDPFGSLAALPDGVVLPEIGPDLWNAREDLDRLLPWVLRLVDATDLPDWYDEQIDREKNGNPRTKDGRDRQVTTRAVMVAWFLLKITRRPLTHTEVGRFLLHNLNDERRALLGFGAVVPDPTGRSPLSRSLLDKQAAAARVGRLVKWMNLVVDPSEYHQPRSRVHPDRKETLRRDVSAADLQAARERLDWVVTQIMAAPLKAMPRRVRRQWDGGAAVDDTHLPVAARRATRTKVAFDIDSGEYRRTKPTGDRHAPKAKGGKGAKVQEVTRSVQASTSRSSSPATRPPATDSTSRPSRSASPRTPPAPTPPATPSGSCASSTPPASARDTSRRTASTRTRRSRTGTVTCSTWAGRRSSTTASTRSAGRGSPGTARSSLRATSTAP